MPLRDRVKQPKEPSPADTNTPEVKKESKQTNKNLKVFQKGRAT